VGSNPAGSISIFLSVDLPVETPLSVIRQHDVEAPFKTDSVLAKTVLTDWQGQGDFSINKKSTYQQRQTEARLDEV